MRFLSLVSCALLFAAPVSGGPAGEPAWHKAADLDGIVVYTRDKEGYNLQEMKAVGTIDAPPAKVWAAIRDYDNYKKTMPYTEESRVLRSELDGKVVYFYSVISAPLVSRRDYVIKVVDESDWRDGKGFLKTSWTAYDKGPPERPGYVRVRLNVGYWLLEPEDDGRKTLATYYVFTDPGGALPKWIANRANGTAVPNVFKAIRRTTSGH